MTPPDRAPEPLTSEEIKLRNLAHVAGSDLERLTVSAGHLRFLLTALDAARDSRPVGEGPFFPVEEDDDPVTGEKLAGLLILHAEEVHGCDHCGQFREMIGMYDPAAQRATEETTNG